MRTVYKLLNANDEVIYVGETGQTLKARLYQHNIGKYPNAIKILSIVKDIPTRKESYKIQCDWQKHYGLKTDAEKQIPIGKKSAKKNLTFNVRSKVGKKTMPILNSMRVTCPICNEYTNQPGVVGRHKKKCKG